MGYDLNSKRGRTVRARAGGRLIGPAKVARENQETRRLMAEGHSLKREFIHRFRILFFFSLSLLRLFHLKFAQKLLQIYWRVKIYI